MPGTVDKLLAIAVHLSGFISLPFILPLIVYLVKRGESPYVEGNAREALNFHITVFFAAVLAGLLVLVLVGFLFLWLIGIAFLVLSIVAAIKAAEGKVYRYPLCLRLVP